MFLKTLKHDDRSSTTVILMRLSETQGGGRTKETVRNSQ